MILLRSLHSPAWAKEVVKGAEILLTWLPSPTHVSRHWVSGMIRFPETCICFAEVVELQVVIECCAAAAVCLLAIVAINTIRVWLRVGGMSPNEECGRQAAPLSLLLTGYGCMP